MARTSQEIEQDIDNEAALYSELDDLQNNSSMMAFWKYTKKIIVFVALTLEKMFDQHRLDVNSVIDGTETGSIEWYATKFKEYQHGDSLVIENNRPIYALIDENKKIVKRVSVEEKIDINNNVYLLVKAVKEVGGLFEPLDLTEKAGFGAYTQRFKIAGTLIVIESSPFDELTIDCEAVLNPLLFDANGLLISDGSEPVKEVMENHLKNFAFGSTFILSKLIDEMMEIEGVVDFHINSTFLGAIPFTRSIDSPAGHIRLSNTSNIGYVLS